MGAGCGGDRFVDAAASAAWILLLLGAFLPSSSSRRITGMVGGASIPIRTLPSETCRTFTSIWSPILNVWPGFLVITNTEPTLIFLTTVFERS